MCGIWCCVTASDEVENKSVCTVCNERDEKTDRMLSFLTRRGPDISFSSCISINPANSQNDENTLQRIQSVHFSGHVLWTQGPESIAQPYVNAEKTKFFLFNGDIYSFDGTSVKIDETPSVFHEKNDGLMLFDKLQEATEDCSSEKMINAIGNLRGPFAFVYFDKVKNKIWFARDFFGRESLLFSYYPKTQSQTTTWNISSISVFDQVFEIPTAGLYELDIDKLEVSLIPYACHGRSIVLENVQEFSKFLESIGLKTRFEKDYCDKLIHLSFSTKFRSTLTDNDNSCDILMKLTQLASMDTLSPAEVLISATKILDVYVTKFINVLRHSVRLRLKAISPLCRDHNCLSKDGMICENNLVGVLFSGGLDSTVLAYLAAEANEGTLELISVAFSKTDNYTNIPDRETALESFKVLNKIFEPQGKNIRLVLVNGTKDEVEEMRRERVKTLISPLKSVIDDSVGCCLWFAARGHGTLDEEEALITKSTNYKSTVRTVLLGSGADELLGGYSRHRSSFEKSGWTGLGSEMQFDIDRISIRNLGRDNRVVSDHEVCPRMPYLDEGVVNFLTQECDLWVKCCPLLGDRGLGEKLLLRATAVKLFGEENVHIAMFPKRAMQFGSRIAKLENSKEKGGDDCDRLK